MRSKVFCAAIALLFSIFAGDSLLAQSRWLNFTDVTDTNISTPNAQTTINDVEEKDIAIGDLNGDGLDDVVIVRKVPFSESRGKTTVILVTYNNKLHNTSRWAGFEFFNIPDDARDIVIFDANGDGRNDILTVNTFGKQPRLFLNIGNFDRAVPIPRFIEADSKQQRCIVYRSQQRFQLPVECARHLRSGMDRCESGRQAGLVDRWLLWPGTLVPGLGSAQFEFRNGGRLSWPPFFYLVGTSFLR